MEPEKPQEQGKARIPLANRIVLAIVALVILVPTIAVLRLDDSFSGGNRIYFEQEPAGAWGITKDFQKPFPEIGVDRTNSKKREYGFRVDYDFYWKKPFSTVKIGSCHLDTIIPADQLLSQIEKGEVTFTPPSYRFIITRERQSGTDTVRIIRQFRNEEKTEETNPPAGSSFVIVKTADPIKQETIASFETALAVELHFDHPITLGYYEDGEFFPTEPIGSSYGKIKSNGRIVAGPGVY